MMLNPLTPAPNNLPLQDQCGGSTTHGILDHSGLIIPNLLAEVLEVARGDLRIRQWSQLRNVGLISQAPFRGRMTPTGPDPSGDVYQVLVSHLSNILPGSYLMAMGELSQLLNRSRPPLLKSGPDPLPRRGRLPTGSHFLTRRNSEGLTRIPLSR